MIIAFNLNLFILIYVQIKKKKTNKKESNNFNKFQTTHYVLSILILLTDVYHEEIIV